MTEQHPITPSRGLVEEWVVKLERHNDAEVFTEAARWGANQELDACCEWIANNSLHHAESDLLNDLRAARRPQPKSLAEEALEDFEGIAAILMREGLPCNTGSVRRALERLQELEGQGQLTKESD